MGEGEDSSSSRQQRRLPALLPGRVGGLTSPCLPREMRAAESKGWAKRGTLELLHPSIPSRSSAIKGFLPPSLAGGAKDGHSPAQGMEEVESVDHQPQFCLVSKRFNHLWNRPLSACPSPSLKQQPHPSAPTSPLYFGDPAPRSKGFIHLAPATARKQPGVTHAVRTALPAAQSISLHPGWGSATLPDLLPAGQGGLPALEQGQRCCAGDPPADQCLESSAAPGRRSQPSPASSRAPGAGRALQNPGSGW